MRYKINVDKIELVKIELVKIELVKIELHNTPPNILDGTNLFTKYV